MSESVTLSPSTSPTVDDQDDKEEMVELSDDELFIAHLRSLLGSYSDRQREILRLARYAETRAVEIDGEKIRAIEHITRQIGEMPNEDTVEELLALFARMEQDAPSLDGEGTTAALTSFVSGVKEVTEHLPDGVVSTYLDGVIRASTSPPAVGLLRSSLLVSLVGELEMLVNQVARAGFERFPQKLGNVGKEFTWSDIKNFGSIEEIRDAVVDHTVEDALRGSLTDWIEYFKKRFNISAVAESETYAAQEVVQRRHCIVHNAGLVSSQYISKLNAFRPSCEVGESLDVSEAYLTDAADTLYLVGFSLVWQMGFKLAKEPAAIELFESSLANRAYFLLQDRRFELLKKISHSKAHANLKNEETKFVFQVNIWLAHKLSEDFQAVRKDVEGLITTGKSRKYNLVKHALLDEDEQAYNLALQLVRDGQLDPEFMYTWPLLSGARAYSLTVSSNING